MATFHQNLVQSFTNFKNKYVPRYFATEDALDAVFDDLPEGTRCVTPEGSGDEISAVSIGFDNTNTDLDSEDVNSAIIEAYNKTRIVNYLFKFGSNNIKTLNITGGINTKPKFGMSEDTVDTNDTTGNQTFDAFNGHTGTVNGANPVVTLQLETKAMYIFLCSSYTLSSGAIYGATARLFTTHGLSTGTPNNVSLGQTSNAPATITLAANNTLTIKNGNAGRATQYNLIRVL